MINAYSEILSYEGDDWNDFFTRIALIEIFKELMPLFSNKESLTKAIRYIVMSYSKNSDCVIVGSDWFENKKRIFTKSMLHPDYFNDFVNLQNRIVIKTIKAWLNFQDDATFSQILMLKDLLQEMQISANSDIKKASGETDFDQKFKNAKYVNELKIMIDDLEQELIQNNAKLKEAFSEVSRASNKIKNTVGVESFAN